MKLFIDSANLHDIEEALQRGVLRGITTNPSLLAKEPRRDFTAHIRDIIALLRRYEAELPLSVELFTTEPAAMARQASQFLRDFGDYEPLSIKVPIGWHELQVIHAIRQRGGRVNCTCCMSFNQAVMAASAGATYVSVFWGRIRDTGYDAATIVRQIKDTFVRHGCPTELIVGSIRQMVDVNEAILAGADIVTVPPALLPALCAHPKTTEAVEQFIRDFRAWTTPPPPLDRAAPVGAQAR